MPVHLVPQRTDIAGHGTPVVEPRPAVRVFAASLLALLLATAPSPARAASVLSDGSVTPPSGTTATAFTFSVHYTSTDSPTRPAQAVWAQVGSVTVTLIKVSGSAHDGTWQGTATLPAGTWDVSFHATTSSDPQPEPLLGPKVTVTEPPPTPPPPTPTPFPTPQPTATLEPPSPTLTPPPDPTPRPPPTPPPTGGDPTNSLPSPTPTPSASGSARPGTPVPTPTRTANEADVPTATVEPSDPPADDEATPPGSRLASLLIIGGTMSLAGAAVLARQLFVARGARPR